MLKTAPVLPGVCVGGPESESNNEAVEGILTTSLYFSGLLGTSVCVCVRVSSMNFKYISDSSW